MNYQDRTLEIIDAITQPLFALVLIIGAIVCRSRLNSSRPREARLVGLAIGLFVARIVVLAVLTIAVSLFFRPSLWELAQSNRFYASVNWWFGLITALIYSSFYAAAWGMILFAAFGPGSSSIPRFLVDEEKGRAVPPPQPRIDE